MKFDCIMTNEDIIKMNDFNGETIYEVKRKMEFNSDRKRMSVIIRDPADQKIKLLIKGADSIILDRLDRLQYGKDLD